jgi:D-3-phosphoglycerate dehydrogenase
MSFRVFVTGSGIAQQARQFLEDEGCTVEVGSPRDTPRDIEERVRAFQPEAMIVRQGKITADVQTAAPSLRVICKHGVGTDNIDIEAATLRGIPVMYTPSANYESVAEHTLALILALLRRITLEDGRVRSGIFDKAAYAGLELRGKTLAVVGFGRVGRRLAELAGPFGTRVVVHHPSRNLRMLPEHVSQVQRLEDALADADIVSLHCPLTAQTRNLINDRTIAVMKQGAYLVNTARGGVVDEAALAEGLRSGRIAGAALDVFASEPPDPANPLLAMTNVIFTTHVAGVSDNSYLNMGMESARNVLAVLRGEPVDAGSVVSREARGNP